MTELRQQLELRWARLDPKLKYTVLSGAVSWAVVKYGIQLDATLSAVVTAVVGSLAGYRVPNDGTVLRGVHDDGNAQVPAKVDPAKPPS